MEARRLGLLITNCISSKSLRNGKLIHKHIISCGLWQDTFLCKKLINLYVSLDSLESARLVFRNIENPLDISVWNNMLTAYSRNHLYRETLLLFEELKSFSCIKPDSYSFPSALKALGALGCVEEGKKVHCGVIKCGSYDVVVASALVGMYAKCNHFVEAYKVFDEMADRDVASWNTVISCYYQDGQYEKALNLFDQMRHAGFEPDSVTYTTVFSSCARLCTLDQGKKIHEALLEKGYVLDVFMNSSLVDMYARCGSLDVAQKIFDLVPKKTVVTWNSMISGYATIGDWDSSLHLFLRMVMEGVIPTSTTLSILLSVCAKSSHLNIGKCLHGYSIRNNINMDVFLSSALLDLYLKCGSLVYAQVIFTTVSQMNCVLWNVMISGLVSRGCCHEALKTFSDMRNVGVQPDAITFASILSACSQLSALEAGKEIHQYLAEYKLETEKIVATALVDMYAKCGAVDDARRVFDVMPKKDVVSWTTMITAYGSHGNAMEALYLFRQMESIETKPDSVTFLALLSACSHGGLVDEGYYYFRQMKTRHGINPTLEHYSCVIDLLGRLGKVYDAYDIINQMPIPVDTKLLGTLFSACKQHGKLDLGEEIAMLLIEKDPDDVSIYVLLANMYAAFGKWDEAREVRSMMRQRGLRKIPGCSWIEVDKMTHTFFSEDKSHARAEEIYESIESLLIHMKREGYIPKAP